MDMTRAKFLITVEKIYWNIPYLRTIPILRSHQLWLYYNVLDTSGLKLVPLMSITIDGKDNVYLSTEESVWRSNPDSVVSVAEIPEVPTEYRLYQKYPNPFNPTTTIKYSVKEAGMVTLTVYDILGKEVTSLVNEIKSQGEYSVVFEGTKLSSGIYFYTMRAGGYVATNKFLLLK
jgi:hypothetical protein